MQTLACRNRLDIKPTIKGTPCAISPGGSGEKRNTQYIFIDCKDKRGDASEAAPGCLFVFIETFSFIDTFSFNTMMNRE
jgi:hypothetical protein